MSKYLEIMRYTLPQGTEQKIGTGTRTENRHRHRHRKSAQAQAQKIGTVSCLGAEFHDIRAGKYL